VLRRFSLAAVALVALAALALPTTQYAAQAQTPAAGACKGTMRKIDIGVAVSPPNVIHTVPYVAKALGYFQKHCVDANIVQFNGGTVGTIVAAISQGHTTANLTDIAIAHGLKAKQVWQMAPRMPQAYVVGPEVKTAADLKGKRLSAAGGGVGSLNWLMGREVLRSAHLNVDDAQFVAQDTAGRLPGFVAGQVDAVVLHPEDTYLAMKQKPGSHVLVQFSDLLPNYAFNAYGVGDVLISSDPALVRDTMAALIEASREIYRDKNKVIPIMVDATQKPREAVEYAYDVETKNCNWAVNTGFNPVRTMWTEDHDIADGYIEPAKKVPFDQIVDMKIANDALAEAGGRTTIGKCKD
jgi:ABC-type nitrate/sulfonate/bicarbonate transport system substrate-binding protein